VSLTLNSKYWHPPNHQLETQAISSFFFYETKKKRIYF
jgi:hypothetical protein